MNPGHHGPEPWRGRVLDCPPGSAKARLNSIAAYLVSWRDLQEPWGAGNP